MRITKRLASVCTHSHGTPSALLCTTDVHSYVLHTPGACGGRRRRRGRNEGGGGGEAGGGCEGPCALKSPSPVRFWWQLAICGAAHSAPQRCSVSPLRDQGRDELRLPLCALTTALPYLPAPRPRARRAPPPVATSYGWARETEPEIGPEIGREIEPTRDLAGCSRGG